MNGGQGKGGEGRGGGRGGEKGEGGYCRKSIFFILGTCKKP
jgi:hypothetical protein